MDAHSPPLQTTHDGARFLSPLRIVALGLIAAAAGLAVWQLREDSREGSVPLLADTLLPSSELALMEAAFDRAKLTDYAIDGGRILVPKGRQSSYMRALVDAEALPREFGGSLRRAMETSSPWQSRAVQDERVRIATQEELSLVLCSMPGIRRAAVLYDQEARASLGVGRALGSSPRQTASVNIETDEDAALDRVRARSIRVLVAASIAGLQPEDVAVTDLRSGLVYTGPLEPAMADVSPAEAERIAVEERIADRIRRSLAYVQGAIIDVRAELGSAPPAAASRPKPQQNAADANTPADVRSPLSALAAPPTVASQLPDGRQVLAVHAAVAVPESSSIGSEDGIRQHVLSLLPATADPQSRSVKVTRFRVGSASIPEPVRQPADEPVQPEAVASSAEPQLRSAARPEPAAALSAGFPAFSIDALSSMPSQVWLSVLATAAIAFAALLWWSGTERRPPAEPAATIDWTAHSRGTPVGDHPVKATTRAAATVLACCMASGFTAQADEPPAALSPALLAAPVLLADPADDAPSELSTDEGAPPADESAAPQAGFEIAAAVTLAGAVLALVALSWFGKKQSGGVPRDVFEVLGSGHLDRGQRVAVVRFGPKTLLVSVGSSSCSTLSELDDATATETIAQACRPSRMPGKPRGSLRAIPSAASSLPTARPSEEAA